MAEGTVQNKESKEAVKAPCLFTILIDQVTPLIFQKID